MGSNLTRRDFLKLVSLLPLTQLKIPEINVGPLQLRQQVDLPNILVLVFDALSASHVSHHGYPRDTTPNLNRFAERATVFHSHYAAGNFTSPGTASILTGTYPWSHRAFHLHGLVLDSYQDKNIFSLLSQKGYHRIAYSHNLLVSSLLFQFKEHLDDYLRTRELCLGDIQIADLAFPKDTNIAFYGEWLQMRGGEYPSSLHLSFLHRMYRYVNKKLLEREYGELFPRGIPNLHNLFFILEDAIDWLKKQVISLPQPYFAYIHLLPPHEPFTTRRDFVDVFRDVWKPEPKPVKYFDQGYSEDVLNSTRREYDEYIAYTDAEFGRLYDYMQNNGMFENTCVIVTTDHGKLFERGILGHVTGALYQPILNVPLVVSMPGQRMRRDVYSPTSCVDLIPTILKLVDSPIPDWVEGSPLPIFSDHPPDPERAIYAVEAKSNPKLSPLTRGSVAMIKGDYKLTKYFGYGNIDNVYELFDLSNDPEELHNLVQSNNSLSIDLQAQLEQKLREVNLPYIK
jgi:arylsulfatase A-like enzyme